MNVFLVAQDIAPSTAFRLLEAELKRRGHAAKTLVGKGNVFPVSIADVRQAVREASVVVVGMSSSAKLAEPEIAAFDEATTVGIPFGFYGDTYHCHERAGEDSWFGPARRVADFFFAINKEEANAAKTVLTNPNLKSIVTGNPMWEDYAFPKFTREEVRAKYNIADDEILVLAPGLKIPAINLLNWGLLVEAVSGLERKIRIFIYFHSGDKTPLSVYEDLKTFSPVPIEFLDAGVRAADVLPGTDVVVAWNCSVVVEAAHQRIPVVALSTKLGRRRVFSESNTEKWEPVELGVAVEANCGNLKDKLDIYTNSFEQINDLKKRQAEVYPKSQEKGSAVRKMADALESLVK